MKLSKQTSDAIQILCHCYRKEDNLSKAGDIAQELGLTKQMAFKLVKILNKAGFIETVRGPHGGIKLSEATKIATLGFIVRNLESKPTASQAEQNSYLLSVYIDEAFEAFLEVLDQHSLADMAIHSKATANVRDKREPKRDAMPTEAYSLRLDQKTTPV